IRRAKLSLERQRDSEEAAAVPKQPPRLSGRSSRPWREGWGRGVFRETCDHVSMPRRVRRLTVDLHGHDVVTALELAIVRVSEAQRNGYEEIELQHGAADVEEPVEEGRGRIKWELRRMARTGRFNQWA